MSEQSQFDNSHIIQFIAVLNSICEMYSSLFIVLRLKLLFFFSFFLHFLLSGPFVVELYQHGLSHLKWKFYIDLFCFVFSFIQLIIQLNGINIEFLKYLPNRISMWNWPYVYKHNLIMMCPNSDVNVWRINYQFLYGYYFRLFFFHSFTRTYKMTNKRPIQLGLMCWLAWWERSNFIFNDWIKMQSIVFTN